MEKTHPEWQKGKLNGIGGKMEEGETVIGCMAREAEEETGLKTKENDWQHFATVFETGAQVDFFGLIHHGDKNQVKTTTDEVVSWYPATNLPKNAITNVFWLVPMALEKLKGRKFKVVEVKYLE